MKMKNKLAGGGGLVAVLTSMVFIPVLQGVFLHWDDWPLFVDNCHYKGFLPQNIQWMATTFMLGHWQPLTWISCALDYTIWGLNPAGWHGTNLLIHAVNSVLIYLLCLCFLQKQGGRQAAAALAALFWAVHPLRVEAVAWLATRGYLLGTTFCLLTVLFYLKWGGVRPPGAFEHARRARSTFYLASLLCFTLASVTKGIGMMLPLVLLLIDWHSAWCKEQGNSFWKGWIWRIVEKIPFFMLSLLTGVMAFQAKQVAGGMAAIEKYGLHDRIGQALYGIWFYLAKTVMPTNLSALYFRRPSAGALLLVLALTMLSTAILVFFRKKLFPIIGTLGAFLLLIFPMLGITQSGIQMAADRFTYLAAIPFSVLLVAGLGRLRRLRRVVFGALAALLVCFGVQTAVWSSVWSDDLSLWFNAIAVDDENSHAYNSAGIKLMSSGLYGQAFEYFSKAIELEPDYVTARHNRAVVMAILGKYEEALDELNVALTISPELKPDDHAKILLGRGWVLSQLEQDDEAAKDYKRMGEMEINPVWKARARKALRDLDQ